MKAGGLFLILKVKYDINGIVSPRRNNSVKRTK